jgi:hypothetical protein
MESYGLLRCPVCGDEFAHIERVAIAAGAEDQERSHLLVDAVRGRIETRPGQQTPAGVEVGEGRRHRIALLGYCEDGGHAFAFVLTQHQGQTYLEGGPRPVAPEDEAARPDLFGPNALDWSGPEEGQP